MESERRKLSRRNFSYYMRIMDEVTGKLIGHLSDISTTGFKVDSAGPVPINGNFRLRIEQIGDISKKMYIIFKARSMWCRPDRFDPNLYNVGFKIVEMDPTDYDIFLKMFDEYGTKNTSETYNSNYS